MSDLSQLVDAVCEELQMRNQEVEKTACEEARAAAAAVANNGLSSRHHRLCQARRRLVDGANDFVSVEPMVFRYEVEGILNRYRALMQTPVRWMGSSEKDQRDNEQRESELLRLRKEFADVLERHAPHMVKLVWAPGGDASPPASPANACPMCSYSTVGALINAPGASGACEVCQSVLYDHAINLTYQQHHTIGMVNGTVATKPSTATFQMMAAANLMALDDADNDTTHQVLSTVSGPAADGHHHARSGSLVLYQRRTQFRPDLAVLPRLRGNGDARDRTAMAQYQGKATRVVPAEVVEDVRSHMENLRHLLDVNATDARTRYARVTRVHVLCILRASGNGRYSRWYKEANFLHATLTQQPPPDISDIESTLIFMFGIGNSHPRQCLLSFFFWLCCFRSIRDPIILILFKC